MTAPASHSAPPAAAPSTGSAVRLLVLLGLLAIVVGAWAYDYFVAAPGSENTYKKIQDMVDAKNAQGVRAGGVVRAKDVQDTVGFAPTWVEKKPDHTIEWYCWWGKIPVLSTWKRYITVVYVGDTFNTHHQNEPPPAEALPGYLESQTPKQVELTDEMKAKMKAMQGAMGGPMAGPPGGGGRGGPGGGVQPPDPGPDTTVVKPGESSTGDKPTEGPAANKPAEAPKESDKPAEAPKAEEKPTEPPK